MTVGDETLYFNEIETLNSYFQLLLIEEKEFLLKINTINKQKGNNNRFLDFIIELKIENYKLLDGFLFLQILYEFLFII